MVKFGHQVTCFNRKGHYVSGSEFDGSHLCEYRGVKLKPVWTLDKKGLAAMTSSLSAAIKVAFGEYDIVHFHAEGPCAMLWIPKLFGKRCIVTIHGAVVIIRTLFNTAKWQITEFFYSRLRK